MIRLGHIDYSNCIPVHAQLLGPEAPPDLMVLRGVPTALNQALAEGRIDAAPCSSIEYARHAAEYRLLPLTIASRGAVQSILFECDRPPAELAGATVALPTASATSIVLLRILLERHWQVRPRYVTFGQTDEDPFRSGAAAALWIGDVALRRVPGPGRALLDLGAEWWSWTGLPFAFALWQVRRDLPAAELRRLATLLAASRRWFRAREAELALAYGPTFGLAPHRLRRYWDSLVYDLADDVLAGLRRFLDLAAELGEAPPVPEPEIVLLA
ncbi:MAG: menaquinone biosynthesis protein [Gemmatimonadetes bacterium]|nr:menaquinone biosynthesis protein [Gemmatimonadota bacterium]